MSYAHAPVRLRPSAAVLAFYVILLVRGTAAQSGNSTEETTGKKGGLSPAVLGAIIGVVAFLATLAIVGGLWWFLRVRKRRNGGRSTTSSRATDCRAGSRTQQRSASAGQRKRDKNGVEISFVGSASTGGKENGSVVVASPDGSTAHHMTSQNSTHYQNQPGRKYGYNEYNHHSQYPAGYGLPPGPITVSSTSTPAQSQPGNLPQNNLYTSPTTSPSKKAAMPVPHMPIGSPPPAKRDQGKGSQSRLGHSDNGSASGRSLKGRQQDTIRESSKEITRELAREATREPTKEAVSPTKPIHRLIAKIGGGKKTANSSKTSITEEQTKDAAAAQKDDKSRAKRVVGPTTAVNRVAAWRRGIPSKGPAASSADEEPTEEPTPIPSLGPTPAVNKSLDEEALEFKKKLDQAKPTFLSVDPRPSEPSNLPDETMTSLLGGSGPAGPAGTVVSGSESVTGDLFWILTGGRGHRPADLSIMSANQKRRPTESVYTASSVGGVGAGGLIDNSYGIGLMDVVIPEDPSKRPISSGTQLTGITNDATTPPNQKKRPTSDALTLPSYYTNRPNTPSTEPSLPPVPPLNSTGSPVPSSGIFSDNDDIKSVMMLGGGPNSTSMLVSEGGNWTLGGVPPMMLGIGMTNSTRRRMDKNHITGKDLDRLMISEPVPPIPNSSRVAEMSSMVLTPYDKTPSDKRLPLLSGKTPEVDATNPTLDSPAAREAMHLPGAMPLDDSPLRSGNTTHYDNTEHSILKKKSVGLKVPGKLTLRKSSDKMSASVLLGSKDGKSQREAGSEEDGSYDEEDAPDASCHSAAIQMMARRKRQELVKRRSQRAVNRTPVTPTGADLSRASSGRWEPITRSESPSEYESDDASSGNEHGGAPISESGSGEGSKMTTLELGQDAEKEPGTTVLSRPVWEASESTTSKLSSLAAGMSRLSYYFAPTSQYDPLPPRPSSAGPILSSSTGEQSLQVKPLRIISPDSSGLIPVVPGDHGYPSPDSGAFSATSPWKKYSFLPLRQEATELIISPTSADTETFAVKMSHLRSRSQPMLVEPLRINKQMQPRPLAPKNVVPVAMDPVELPSMPHELASFDYPPKENARVTKPIEGMSANITSVEEITSQSLVFGMHSDY